MTRKTKIECCGCPYYPQTAAHKRNCSRRVCEKIRRGEYRNKVVLLRGELWRKKQRD